MGQTGYARDEKSPSSLKHWFFRETVRIEHEKQALEEEKKAFEHAKLQFERDRKTFKLRKEMEVKQLEREQKLFDAKWKILESELLKVAADRDFVKREKARSQATKEKEYERNKFQVGTEAFFVGVTNQLALKKRYKDLVKIFHPDNLHGDKGILQEINKDYESLKRKMDV